MKAVVMAGGEGTRLRPLTSNKPKPLMPVVNKPIMEHIIDLLKLHGLHDIVVTLHYLADEIESYFGDGSDFGVHIRYSVEDTPLGTAGSVRKAKRLIGGEPVLIISGDALTDVDLSAAIAWHQERRSQATMILKSVPNPLEYGVVITDAKSRISKFLEKPSWGEVFSDTVNTGMYVLEPEVLAQIPDSGPVDFSQDVFPELLRQGTPPYGYVAPGYWCDIGNLEQYRQAHMDVLSGDVKVRIPGDRAGNVWIGKGSEVHPSVEITGPTVIGRNCRIKEGVRFLDFAVIGDNSLIEQNGVLRRTILWENNYVGKNAKLYDSMIAAGCILKANVSTNEDTVIGDRCRVEEGSTLRRGIKVWPDKVIEAGATVTMSLVWGSKWRGSLFKELGISGLANVEITPDYVTKLGSAYGATLKKGSLVLASRDADNVSRMLKRSMISALVSVGMDVLDLRSLPSPIARHSLRGSGAAGGIHVRIAPDNPQLSLIEFFDDRGINISKAAERRIENTFFREDFRRTDPEGVGEIEFASRALEMYYQSFFHSLDLGAVENAGFRVVIDYGFGRLCPVLPGILGRLGVSPVALNAYTDPRRSHPDEEQQRAMLENLSGIVKTLKADAGVFLDSEGERLVFVDDRGRVLTGNHLLALTAQMMLAEKPGATVALPVTVPIVVERIISGAGGRVLRTKADVRALMSAAVQDETVVLGADERGGFIFPQFQPVFDSMFALARVLALMASSGKKLSQLANQIPPFAIVNRLVYCPWERKGRVMRLLREREAAAASELIDGIRVNSGPASALVLPHSSEPYFRIHAEAEASADAQAFADRVAEEIEKLQE